VFGSLLFMDFVLMFSFSFVEPEMVFYAYEQLNLTTSQFGLLIMCYGLALVAGQFGLSGLSDRFGRRAVIVSGLAIMNVFYIGFLVSTNYPFLLACSVVSGLGEAIAMPALAAVYLDMTNERHRSRVMGLRSSATSLAAVAGPALIAAVAGVTTTMQVFGISLGVGVAAAILAIFTLRKRARVSDAPPDDTCKT
jgi:MFS family permease